MTRIPPPFLRFLLPLLLVALLIPALPVRAEEDLTEQNARDADAQEGIDAKLQDLQTGMELLAAELERTGHTYEAGLLRAGLAYISTSDLNTAIRQVLEALKAGRTQTARDHSREVLEALQKLLLILEDRNREHTRNEILERLEAAKEAAERARELEEQEADLQRRIEEATDDARSEAARGAEEIRAEVAALRAEQEALRAAGRHGGGSAGPGRGARSPSGGDGEPPGPADGGGAADRRRPGACQGRPGVRRGA